MRPPSSSGEGLIGPLFGWAQLDAELDDLALLRAMLDVERAISEAGAEVGLVPPAAAAAIAAACAPDRYDLPALGRAGEAAGNPAAPLVDEIVAAVPDQAAAWVHHGATSQDVLDSALMLLARRAGAVLVAELAAASDACAALARQHRDTLMPARTLGQQAAPTTFGLCAAGWLVGLTESGARLRVVLADRVAVQLGGAAGTLAAYGAHAAAMTAALARRLALAEPLLPWHTDRQRVLELGSALAGVAAALGKIALDVGLLAQTELGEVAEGGTGRGGSSAMPHKRNPVDSVLVSAAAIQVPGLVATLHTAARQEHQRAAGGWHAEWEPLRDLMSLVGGATARGRRLLDNLQVHPERMRGNLDSAGGRLMADSVAGRLAPVLGRAAARDLVARCCTVALDSALPLRDVLLADPTVRRHLTEPEIDAALDPSQSAHAAGRLVDRALSARDGPGAGLGRPE